MALIGIIVREPRIGLEEWLNLAASKAGLSSPPAREGTNPFTGKPCIFKPPAGLKNIEVGGVRCGAIEPSPEFEDDGELHVSGAEPTSPLLKEFVAELVAELQGTVQWIEDGQESHAG